MRSNVGLVKGKREITRDSLKGDGRCNSKGECENEKAKCISPHYEVEVPPYVTSNGSVYTSKSSYCNDAGVNIANLEYNCLTSVKPKWRIEARRKSEGSRRDTNEFLGCYIRDCCPNVKIILVCQFVQIVGIEEKRKKIIEWDRNHNVEKHEKCNV